MTPSKPILVGLEVVGQYAVPHVVIRLPRGEPAGTRVENLAQSALEKSDYRVFAGGDANLFFSMLSINFRESHFFEVCKTHVGEAADQLLRQLEERVSRCLAASDLSDEWIDSAATILERYYSIYPSKAAVHLEIANAVRQLDRSAILRVVRFYRDLGYKTKGAPDLFLVRGSSFWFAEVKSAGDSLSRAQYEFFEGFLRIVGENILVLRVLWE